MFFYNSNLSQEIFVIDTWGTVICSLGHGRKHMLTILPTIWKPGLIFKFAVKNLKDLQINLFCIFDAGILTSSFESGSR